MRYFFVGNVALVHIEPGQEMWVFQQGLLIALIRQRKDVWERDVIQGEGGCTWYATRHIGDTIVNHIVDGISRFGVGSGTRRLEAASLIDRVPR